MPIPTSSMYPNPNARRLRVRQLWASFEHWVHNPRQDMVRTRDEALREADRKWRAAAQPLSTTTNTANRTTARLTQKEHEASKEKLRKSIERKHYLSMREEWQKRLRAAGLQVEDWDDMTARDQLAVTRALGDFDMGEDVDEGDGDDEEHEEADEDEPFTHLAAQPLSQSVSHQSQSSQSSQSSGQSYLPAPSLASSRSYNTSSASYAFVDPRQFTDDERDEHSLFHPAYNHSGYAPGSEDEDTGPSVPNHKAWARDRQQQPSGYTTAWSSSNQSSLSSSPAAEPSLARHTQQPSSSFSSSHFPPHIPSALSTSTSANADPKPTITTSSIPVSASTSSSSPAPATVPKSKSKLNATYIGPYLTTPDSSSEAEADGDGDFEQDMSEAGQAEAFENFKMGARIQKIREFHEEAAQLDIELATAIWNNRRAAGLPTSISSLGLHGFSHNSGYDKASEAQMVSEHEVKMRELRERKEKERKAVVAAERKRRRDEIKKRQQQAGGSRPANTTTTKGWTNGAHKTAFTSSTTSSSTSNKPSAIPVGHKSKPPVPSSSTGIGGTIPASVPDIDQWQTVLEGAPSLGIDTAWQISQLLSQEGNSATHDEEEHEHSQHDWGTPHAPINNNSGGRKRTESVSILDDSRFGTISAKSLGRRRDTISASVANGVFGSAAHGASTASHSRVEQQHNRHPSSLDGSQAQTDRFARVFLGNGVNANQVGGEEEEEEWDGWGPKPATNVNEAGKGTSGWSAVKKPGAPGSSSSPAMPSAWGAGVKKTFGFGGSNHAVNNPNDFGSEPGWRGEWDNEGHDQEAEEGEEEEGSHPSPFGSATTGAAGPAQKRPSLLSGMMMRGKNVVAGAVNAATRSPIISPATPTTPTAAMNGLLRKGATANAPATTTATTTAPPNATTTPATKKTAKQQRHAANKKGALPSFLKDEEVEEPEPQHQQQQVTPTTPRPPVASTKFSSSAFGSANTDSNMSSAFGFGSSPTSRHAASGAGGLWDDVVSTTPRPGGLSSIFGSHADSGGVGAANGMRKPSGLHREVWKADEGEQEEQEEDEDGRQGGEGGWMPGSLNVRGAGGGVAARSKLGVGAGAAGKKPTGTSTWGWGSAAPPSAGSAATATAPSAKTANSNSKKASLLSAKRNVMMEEIPDEADGPWNRSPSDVLASDSRVILEPKPSKPSSMYEGIFSFAGTSPENVRSGNGTTHTGGGGVGSRGGANVNVGVGEGEEIFNEEWFKKAAMQLKKGTEEGERIFGGVASAGAGSGGPGNKAGSASASASGGINIPGRGTASSGGSKSNNPWGATSSSFSANIPGATGMSGSFKDSSPLANGPPPKIGANASKSSLNQAWGAGISSSPRTDFGFGKNAPAKAKATTETSTRFGMNTGVGWGTASSAASASDGMGYGGGGGGWGEEMVEESPEREEILHSKKRLEELFGNSTGPSSGAKTGVGAGGSQAAKALKARKEQEEREAREAEELEARKKEAEEQAARVKEAKEKEAAAAAAAKNTTAKPNGGGKKGKGKRK